MLKNVILLFIFLIFSNCQEHDPKTEKSNLPVSANYRQNISVAIDFINQYTEDRNKKKDTVLYWAESFLLVTEEFKREYLDILERKGKDKQLQHQFFDPIFDSHNYPAEGFKLNSVDMNSGYITLCGKENTNFKLTVKLYEIDGTWKVDGAGSVNIPQKFRAKRQTAYNTR